MTTLPGGELCFAEHGNPRLHIFSRDGVPLRTVRYCEPVVVHCRGQTTQRAFGSARDFEHCTAVASDETSIFVTHYDPLCPASSGRIHKLLGNGSQGTVWRKVRYRIP